MSWDLPPLGALRVFEAAARLGSFTRAAEELGMTQSAASYQIKVLEERAGTPLFVRKTRRIELTEAGERLAPEASAALSMLADAWLSTKGGRAVFFRSRRWKPSRRTGYPSGWARSSSCTRSWR